MGSFGVGFRFFFEVFEKKKKRRSEGEADRLPLVLRSLARSIPLSISSYHLVHPARAQARAHGVCHCLGGLDVGDSDVGLSDIVPEVRRGREEKKREMKVSDAHEKNEQAFLARSTSGAPRRIDDNAV